MHNYGQHLWNWNRIESLVIKTLHDTLLGYNVLRRFSYEDNFCISPRTGNSASIIKKKDTSPKEWCRDTAHFSNHFHSLDSIHVTGDAITLVASSKNLRSDIQLLQFLKYLIRYLVLEGSSIALFMHQFAHTTS